MPAARSSSGVRDEGSRAADVTVVVGTAGHIDHGKTTLLRALTGIDADRLPEERRRGMTIDVGYAHLRLPDGDVLDFVDVPGHDRLVGNMLVGAGEIDAVLLVVAADDGPRAQTLEHVELLDALGIRRAVVALTKVDLVGRRARRGGSHRGRRDAGRHRAGRGSRRGRLRRRRARGSGRWWPLSSCCGTELAADGGGDAGRAPPRRRPRLRRQGARNRGDRHVARRADRSRHATPPRAPRCPRPRARAAGPGFPRGIGWPGRPPRRRTSSGSRGLRSSGAPSSPPTRPWSRPTASSSRCGRPWTLAQAGGVGRRSTQAPRSGSTSGRRKSGPWSGDPGATSTTCPDGERTAILRLLGPDRRGAG